MDNACRSAPYPLGQGLNAALYYRNTDFREYVSLVPTSAHTGEGVPDILMLLVQLSQKLMIERIMWSEEIVCTVLEIKVKRAKTTEESHLSNKPQAPVHRSC